MTINPNDIEIYFYNTGSGWFIRNNGVTLKHTPTSIEASCSTERSQHKNKDIAWKELELKVKAFKPIQIQQMNPKLMIETLRNVADALEKDIYKYQSGGMLIIEHHKEQQIEITSDLVLRKI